MLLLQGFSPPFFLFLFFLSLSLFLFLFFSLLFIGMGLLGISSILPRSIVRKRVVLEEEWKFVGVNGCEADGFA